MAQDRMPPGILALDELELLVIVDNETDILSSVDEAWHAFRIWERSEQTAWQPILWPFKAVVPVTAVLLMVQGVSELLKSLHAARTGEAFERRDGVSV